MRETVDPALRATDADLLRSVARHLNGTVTAGHLAGTDDGRPGMWELDDTEQVKLVAEATADRPGEPGE